MLQALHTRQRTQLRLVVLSEILSGRATYISPRVSQPMGNKHFLVGVIQTALTLSSA